jgi:hypothetical protein
VGDRIGKFLSLGRKGNYDSQIHYLKNPLLLRGTALRDRLLHEVSQVLTPDPQPQGALHVVRRWDPVTAIIIVLLSVMLSLSASIIWIVVTVNISERTCKLAHRQALLLEITWLLQVCKHLTLSQTIHRVL